MEWANAALTLCGLGAAAVAASSPALRRRLLLSKAKHPSLAGHARMARRAASLVPFYEYDETGFFCSDDAPDEFVALRRAGFRRLSALYQARFAETIRRTAELAAGIADLQFIQGFRGPVPVQPL